MFGIGSTELLVILVVALVVIGPSKLPEMAKTLGKAMGEFRRMSTDVKRTIEMEADSQDRKPASGAAASKTSAAGATEENAAEKTASKSADTVSGDRTSTGTSETQSSEQTGTAGEEKA